MSSAVHGAEGMPNHNTQSMASFVAQTTLPFPRDVPIFREFQHAKFFVRSCFSDYYDYITAAFASTKSGDDTSVFLAYFYLRYKLQHPATTFVFVSYDQESSVTEAVVWKNGAIIKQLSRSQAKRLDEEFKDDPDAIFLLDGTPKRAMPSTRRFVVCSNPSKAWTTLTDEDAYRHGTVYVPLWEVDELKTAARALGLDTMLGKTEDIADFPRSAKPRYEDELEYRFDVFGGVARPCLVTDTKFVNAQQKSLKRQAMRVDLMTGHRERLPRQHCDELRHCLFHCYPSSAFFTAWKLKTASPYVTQLLARRVNAMHTVERAYFEWKGGLTPTIAAFLKALVVGRMLQQLENGVKLVANSLSHTTNDAETDLRLSIQPSATTMTRLSSRFSASDLAGGPCFVLQGNECEWIHALYLIKNEEARACVRWRGLEAVVFIAPSVYGYCLPGKDLYRLLQRLGLADNAPLRVALVCCVLETRVDDLDERYLTCGWGLGGASPVTVVDGITTEMAIALQACSVHNVHDLRDLRQRVTHNEEQARLFEQAYGLMREADNEAVADGSASYAMLCRIRQFVWGV